MGEPQQDPPNDKPPEIPKPTAAIAVVDGKYKPKDHRELSTLITAIAKGGGFPDCFNTYEQRVAAYNLAFSLMGDQYQLALNHMAFVKGKLSIYGELPGTLAERTGEVEEHEVYVIDSNYQVICTANKNLGEAPYAGILKIKRKGRREKEFHYTRDQAVQAGQLPAMKYSKQEQRMVPNPDSPWEKYLTTMLMRKANAHLKFEFPEAFVGVPIAEYDFDEAPDLIKDVTPVDKASELNARFAGEGVTNEQPDLVRPSGPTDT